MHILMLYQYFHSPDAPGSGRHYSFVRSWADRHRVTVVATRSPFTDPITHRYPPAPEGVHLETFPVPYANRMGILQRLHAFERFARASVRFGKSIDRPDVVFGTSTPLTVPWAARKVARKWNVPWIFEIRDLWPDFPIEMGAVPGTWLQRRLRSIEHGLYRDADHIITLSPDMVEHVTRGGGKPDRITTLVNGTSFELVDAPPASTADALRDRFGLGNRRVVLYAGSLGRANGIPIILEAAARLRARDDLVFVFIGSGYFEEGVAQAAASESNVVASPSVPKHAIFEWHRLADLCLVTFIDRPILATGSPSKFFDALACGTPVLVTNPGWTQRFVEEHRCGWRLLRFDAQGLASILTDLFDRPNELAERGRRGATVARSHFDRQKMADRIESIMDQMVRKPSRR